MIDIHFLVRAPRRIITFLGKKRFRRRSDGPNFLTLPSEIRVEIYRHIFRGILVYPEPISEIARRCRRWPEGMGIASVSQSILRVCQTCHEEALPVFLSTVTFFIECEIWLKYLQRRLKTLDVFRNHVEFANRVRTICISPFENDLENVQFLSIFPRLSTVVIHMATSGLRTTPAHRTVANYLGRSRTFPNQTPTYPSGIIAAKIQLPMMGFLKRILDTKQSSDTGGRLHVIYLIYLMGPALHMEVFGTLPNEAEDAQLIRNWIEEHNTDKLHFTIVPGDFANEESPWGSWAQ
jgi:hypothetical protein